MQGSILTVAEAAAQLGVTALAVKRIIARGRLKATRIPAGRQTPLVENQSNRYAEWRIVADDLARYVQAGAPDLALPPLEGNPDEGDAWFHAREDQKARMLERAIEKALTEQSPSLVETHREQLQRQFKAGLPLEIELPLSGAALVVFDGPVPVTGYEPPDARGASRYRSYGQLFMAVEMRAAVRTELRVKRQPPTLASLYQGPEEYAALAAAAAENVQNRRLVFSQTIVLQKERTVKALPGDRQEPETLTSTATFSLRLGKLLSAQDFKALHEIAF